MIRVVVAEDQDLVRAGLVLLLAAEDEVEVVADVADGREAVDAVVAHRPDVVLMDVRMPRMDGVAATREIVALAGPRPRVLVLTTLGHDAAVDACLRAGASGYLLKDARPDQLVGALRLVAHGGSALDPAVTGHVLEGFLRDQDVDPELSRRVASLTEREREVLVGISLGRSNAEIAADLHLGESTVKTHVGRIFSKLGVRERAQAVVIAYQSRLVRVGDSQQPEA